jgi:PPE-repeat protein
MKVRIPVLAIVNAIPAAVRAANAVANDDRDASSDGGAKVTAREVTEAIGAFTAALAEEVLPAILAANGCAPEKR